MKTILMIGGSYGIGGSLTQKLREDHRLIVASRTAPETHPNIQHIPFDVLQDDPTSLDLPEQLDGLVYCPGSIELKPFHRLKVDSFKYAMELNVYGLIKILQHALGALKKSEDAAVVVFSTVAVGLGMPFHSNVAVAKGALEGLTRSLAAEWAPAIRVNAIAPSLTDTPLASKWLSSPEKQERMAARHPLKRTGHAKDISGMAAFLLSEDSRWMTGQVLKIDGGISSIKTD